MYIEEGALGYPAAIRVLEKLPKAVRINVSHYKEVFCRKGQQYSVQKASPKLILAVQTKFLRPGSPMCEDYGRARFHYATQTMNCPYDCEYCFLSGMYPSANAVLFVNTRDYFRHIAESGLLPMRLSLSLDGDMLATEGLHGFAGEWIGFCRENPGLTVEIRTKSDHKADFGKPIDNVVFAFTLSPDDIIAKYERRAPCLDARLGAALCAAQAGWRVRLCVDPVIKTENWRDSYSDMAVKTRAVLDGKGLKNINVSVGAFRATEDVFKKMTKSRPDSWLLSQGFVKSQKCGVSYMNYPDEGLITGFIYSLFDGFAQHEADGLV